MTNDESRLEASPTGIDDSCGLMCGFGEIEVRLNQSGSIKIKHCTRSFFGCGSGFQPRIKWTQIITLLS
jgi:hypothetical protein